MVAKQSITQKTKGSCTHWDVSFQPLSSALLATRLLLSLSVYWFFFFFKHNWECQFYLADSIESWKSETLLFCLSVTVPNPFWASVSSFSKGQCDSPQGNTEKWGCRAVPDAEQMVTVFLPRLLCLRFGFHFVLFGVEMIDYRTLHKSAALSHPPVILL